MPLEFNVSLIKALHESNFTAGMSYRISGHFVVIIGLGDALSSFGAKSLPNPTLTGRIFRC